MISCSSFLLVRTLTQVRPAVQGVLGESLKKASSSLPAGGADRILQEMLRDISLGSRGTASTTKASAAAADPAPADLMDVVKSVLKPATLQKTELFMNLSNDLRVGRNPAFISYYSHLVKSVCTCDPKGKDAWDSPACDFHDEATHCLNDFFWGLSVPLSGRTDDEPVVPACIPLVGNCTMVKIHQLQTDKSARFQDEINRGVDDADRSDAKDFASFNTAVSVSQYCLAQVVHIVKPRCDQ